MYRLASPSSMPPLVDQRGDQPGPAGLVGRAEPRTRVAMKVFMERQIVAPIRIMLELVNGAVNRTLARFVADENRNQSIGMCCRDLPDGPLAAVLSGDRDVRAVSLGQLAQRLDH